MEPLPDEPKGAKNLTHSKWAGRLTILLLTGLGFCLVAKIFIEDVSTDWAGVTGLVLLLLGMVIAYGAAFFGGAWMFFTKVRDRAGETKAGPTFLDDRKRSRFLWLSAIVLLSPFILRQWHTPVDSPTPTTVYTTHPFLGDGEYNVRRDGTNVFSLWTDWFDQPDFIYMFADGRRFFCIYDDDTANLVFVTELNPSRTNSNMGTGWPADVADGQEIARRAACVTQIPNGITRLATWPEVSEVTDYLKQMPPGRLNARNMNKLALGIFQICPLGKQYLLEELSTNYHSLW